MKTLKCHQDNPEIISPADRGATTNLSFVSLSLVDYESISLHGDADSISLHHLSHGNNQSDFDKSSTIPRNSDLSFQYRKFAQSKRPSSTVSLLAEPELIGRSVHQLPSNTATIRRKPSSKPGYRRGTISGGVPIPICTPQVPLKAPGGNGGSDENVFTVPPAGGAGGLGYSKLCTSTQSLSALGPSSSSPYYQLIPGQMPIPVPIPTVPTVPSQQPEGSNAKQQQQRQYQQQLQPHINQLLNHQQQHNQLQQQEQYQQLQQQLQHQQQLQQQPHINRQLNHQQQHGQPQQQEQYQHPQQLQQQFQHQQSQSHQHDQYQQQLIQQQQLTQQQKQKLFQQQQAQLQASASQGEPSSVGLSAHYQPQAPPPSSQEELTQAEGGGGGGGGSSMLIQIRGVKLKRTITNDRSFPLLPPPTNHK